MAFPNGSGPHGDRIDDKRFRNPQSPRDEPSFPSFPSPLRALGGMPTRAPTQTTPSERANLHRRFTTNNAPTLSSFSSVTPLSSFGLQRRQPVENTDMASTAAYQKQQILEKKRRELERTRADQAELEREINRLSTDFHRADQRFSMNGFQSEPTTPPEYSGENGFPSALSRPNRFSLSSITSPPGYPTTRAARSGSQANTASAFSSAGNPSQSTPGSRRNSDEEEDQFDFNFAEANNRSRANLNRNSMPVTGFDYRSSTQNQIPDVASVLGINKFLDDEDDHALPTPATSGNGYLRMDTTSNDFPVLIRGRGEDQSYMRLAGTTTTQADAAATQASGTNGADANGWPSFARHRQGQQSLPMNTIRGTQDAEEFDHAEANASGVVTPSRNVPVNQRRSMEVKFSPYVEFENKRPGLLASPPNGVANGIPKLQSSYSTNDIPTLKGANGMNGSTSEAVKTHAEQHLHNHNTSLGRIPPSALNNRNSRDLSNNDLRGGDDSGSFRPHPRALQSMQGGTPPQQPFPSTTGSSQANFQQTTSGPLNSGLQASAPSFGPTSTTANLSNSQMSGPVMPPYNNGYNNFAGYNMNMLTMGMGNMSVGPPQSWNNQVAVYPQYQQPYPAALAAYNPGGRFGGNNSDSQARVIQQRRAMSAEENARFQNMNLEQMEGRIHEYCRDQHGCRFLQKKLEEREPEVVSKIFEEVKIYVVGLMIDPFGNYLCQKLLEYTNNDQRTELINHAAPEMVKIALNQHGTRALQKMIEFISTPEQITTIIHALEHSVVRLIQDLNGNHVIQKCLNHLASENAQFIFDAVCNHCITVGTHRHGCCVIQRCIDHASPAQKTQLVAAITANAHTLVQDPFGNYVVQYILDLGEPEFIQPVCAGFVGSAVPLAKQKFSSNVIEKCIRVAEEETKRQLIEELIDPHEIENLIKDNYGNYVVQTAMEHGTAEMKSRLHDAVIPHIPAIRNTPHGRRILSRIQGGDSSAPPSRRGSLAALPSGAMTPGSDRSGGMPRMLTSPAYSGGVDTSPYGGYARYPNNVASPTPQRHSAGSQFQLQNGVSTQGFQYSQEAQPAMNGVPYGVYARNNQNGFF